MKDFENLNKQIASFIAFTTLMSMPVSANINNSFNNDISAKMTAKIETHEMLLRYAAPQIPINEVKPIIDAPVISMYAAPQIPIDIQPPIQPPIVKYAAPQLPGTDLKPTIFPIFEPVKEPVKQPTSSPALNESSLNLNNQEIGNSVKHQNSVGLNVNNNLQKINNAVTNDFVFTEYGSVRVIEPFSHIVFQ